MTSYKTSVLTLIPPTCILFDLQMKLFSFKESYNIHFSVNALTNISLMIHLFTLEMQGNFSALEHFWLVSVVTLKTLQWN